MRVYFRIITVHNVIGHFTSIYVNNKYILYNIKFFYFTHFTYFNINKPKIFSEFQPTKSLLKQTDHINFETIIITLSKLFPAFSETFKWLSIVFTLP
jgi:hypothetical protein